MKRIILLLGVLLLATTACTPVLPYAALVNGTTISVTTLNDELHAVISNPRYASLLDQSLSAGSGGGGLQPGGANTVNSDYVASQLLFNRVLVTLIEQTVKDEKVEITDAQRAAAEIAVKSGFKVQGSTDDALFNSLPTTYQQYLINRQAALTALIQSREAPYYDAHKSDFATYCISHILVTDPAKAQDIRNQIAGGADFATLAKANSIDTGSAPDGGSLGCVSSTDLAGYVQPFAQAVQKMSAGELSEPVQTQYGFHIIKLTTKTQLAFADAKQQIDTLLNNDFFTGVLAKADIKVNPRYGTFVPGDAATNQQATINPPHASTLAPATTTTTVDPNSLGGVPQNGGIPGDGSGSSDGSGSAQQTQQTQ